MAPVGQVYYTISRRARLTIVSAFTWKAIAAIRFALSPAWQTARPAWREADTTATDARGGVR